MKTDRFIIGLLFLFTSTGVFAQVAKITQFKQHVSNEVSVVNSLAGEQKLQQAVDKLSDLNNYMEFEINHNLKEEYIQARKQDPFIELCMDLKLNAVLKAEYWTNKYQKLQRSKRLAEEALSGISSMRVLDKQDVAWASLEAIYDAFNTIKDVYENVQTLNYYGLATGLKEGLDNFTENYKNYENAKLQGLKTDLKELEMKGLAKKAKKALDDLEPLLSFMKVNSEEADEFYQNIEKVNKICNEVKEGAYIEMQFGDKDYTWNYGPFQKEVEIECQEFIDTEYPCEEFKAKFNKINNRAKADWQRVKNNIEASDDEQNKAFFLKEINNVWPEYMGVVTPKFQESYDLFCKAQSPGDHISTDQPDNNEEIVSENEQQQQQEERRESLFGGSEAEAEAEVVEAEEEGEEEIVTQTPDRNRPHGIDKYWENSIPNGASHDYMAGSGGDIEVRYQLNDRTVGYRLYKNGDNSSIYSKVPYKETVTNNCFLRHGPERKFINLNGEYRLMEVGFYRADLKTGPVALWYGSELENLKVRYFIDDKEVSEQEYRQKAGNDNNLAPYDIYKEEVYKEIPFVNDIPTNLFEKGNEISWYDLKIPDNAFKQVEHMFMHYPSAQQYRIIIENFYLPDVSYGLNPIAERRWIDNGGVYRLLRESIDLGNKTMFREWNKNSGEITDIGFGFSEDFQETGRNEKYKITCGKYSNGSVIYLHNNERITDQEYQQLINANPIYPPADLYASYKVNMPAQSTLSDILYAPWTNVSPYQVSFDQNAEIWQGSVTNGNLFISYEYNHMEAGHKSWHDLDMVKKRSVEVRRNGHRVYAINWWENGNPQYTYAYGKLERPVYVNWNESGSIEKINYHIRSDEEAAYNFAVKDINGGIFRMSDLQSSIMTRDIDPARIPSAEMTPLMRRILAGTNTDVAGPGMEVEIDEEVTYNEETPGGDDNEQDRMQELRDLGGRINDLITKSDEAFNKNYWESGRPQTTQQAENPKKESYDLMHQAMQLASQAKFPSNEAGFYMILAYKLANYSGRVFANVGKKEFFSLAAQNLEKCGNLVQRLNVSKREKAELYVDLAETWREMTRKAFWGNHQYNKMYCDGKVMHYYEKAVQTDPSFEKAKRILEQLRAPKEAVPAEVSNLEPIPAEKWEVAQVGSQMLQQDELIKGPDDIHPMEVATMYVSISGSGKVWIKRSGADDWSIVNKPEIVIFPFDAIKTSDDASGITVKYTSDKAELNIKSGAIVQFENDYILIQRGDVMMQFRKEGERFIVVTPEVGIGVRGTVFEVSVAPDKTTTTYLYSGVVEVRNSTEITYLTPGEKVTATPGEDKMQEQKFNAQQRKTSAWSEIKVPGKKDKQEKKKISPDKQKPDQSGKSVAGIKTTFSSYLLSDTKLGSRIEREINMSKTPAGIQVDGDKLQLLYLDNDLFNIKAWAIDWYESPGDVNTGITAKMQNEGYFPMGISTEGNTFYVLYIKGETNATAWQLVESSQNLQSVSSDIQPWVNKGYIPVGITLHGSWYYTLLIQVQNSSFKNWEISGYRAQSEMQEGIDNKLLQNRIPFGYIEDGNLFNVLFVGY